MTRPKFSLSRALSLPERVGWRDDVIAAALALVYVAWLLTGARSLGFPRDEGVYFRAGSEYFRWYRMLWEHGSEALSRGAIDSAWSFNHEHPALMKTLFGASEYFLHEKYRVFADASTAFRLPGMAMGGLAVAITYQFGARVFGRRAGVMAAALFALMPRVFFHAHLACFDVPITAMWIACVYVYWRALERPSIKWTIIAGLVFGLTLETKHNAWVLPAVFVPHASFVLWRSIRAGRAMIPWSLLSMAVLGPLVLVGLWPYLWHDTHARIQWWVEFHLHHEYYNIEYLGKNYFGPPSPKSYVPVMIAATVPGITLLLFLIGAAERVRVAWARLAAWVREVLPKADGAAGAGPVPARDPRETDLLLGLAFCAAIGPFFLSTTPIFGATKHWLTAYPELAIFAGRGFDLVARAMERALAAWDARRRIAAHAGLVACCLAAPLVVTAHSHPFGLSAYAPLVGGTKGGAELGLNRQFWGFTTQTAAEEFLNTKAPRGSSVFILDTTWDAWARMQEEGRVRSDLRAAGAPAEANFALVQHELHMSEVDYDIWIADGTDAPVYVVTHDDVPIVSVYQRR